MIISTAIAASAPAAFASATASSSPQAQLRSARSNLQQSRHLFVQAQTALKTTTFSARSRMRAALARKVHEAEIRVERALKVVQRLEAQVGHLDYIADCARDGRWKPVIDEVARENGISSAGLYRMMILESGGRRYADSGLYKGLFQYSPSTWQASWNPYRSASIYDGLAQIKATALAIRHGNGRQMWPNTYPAAF